MVRPGTEASMRPRAIVMRALGYDEVVVDRYGSVIGTIEGNRPGPTVLFDGHIDTVPAENAEKWAYPPFEARIADGRIYGRGTSDMKGADAAFTKAVAWFAADRNRDFAGRICVAGVVQEECFEGVASRSVSEICKPDYVIIGESSMCNLKVGQRGRAEIKIEARGVPAHSANPEKGVNAVYKMCGVIDAVRRIVPGEHTVLGRGILELVDIKSEPYPGASVVPEFCSATYDRRLLVGETTESVLASVQSALADLVARDNELQVNAHFTEAEDSSMPMPTGSAPSRPSSRRRASRLRSSSTASAPTAAITQARRVSGPSASVPHARTSPTPWTSTSRSPSSRRSPTATTPCWRRCSHKPVKGTGYLTEKRDEQSPRFSKEDKRPVSSPTTRRPPKRGPGGRWHPQCAGTR